MSSSSAYTIRMFSAIAPANSWTVGPTVPQGEVWVLRCMTIQQTPAANAYVQVARAPGLTNLLGLSNTAGDVFKTWEGRVVLNAGEQMQVYAAVNAATVCITGYQLGTAG